MIKLIIIFLIKPFTKIIMKFFFDAQAQILEQYSQLVKDGGQLVYATCSVLPSENQQQVQHFLQSEAGKRFALIEEHPISATEGYDGFYMAKLVKSE